MKEYSMLITHSKELERDIKIYISLPKDYEKNNNKYPVLYVTDGQILFKDYDGYEGESWGIMDSYMTNPNRKELIIVGVGSNEKRDDELLPFTFLTQRDKFQQGGNANLLLEFIENSLMPIINKKYRTIETPEKTGIMGMSVGGVFSIYAAAKPTIHFARFASISGCLMPVHSKMIKLLRSSSFDTVQRFYFDVGTTETTSENANELYLKTNKEVYDILRNKIKPECIQFNIIPGAKHEEEDWNNRFESIIEYMFSD